ncbi:NK-lysin tandem duplicate 4 isoform X1 [Cynoglossus semilaevis]|uniref:NK-lysin tandem duplicate 4 n=1 Tax=Cynoglossus semilaevis TaxID=244447 RepID=A0A3P8UND7_CYNSE|nr:uncharacterized protein LOC103377993 isoform X1 [Cynoglossus semilaevis]
MNKSPILLFCILAACSVWSVHGKSQEMNIDDEEPAEVELPVEAKPPGLCWGCKWALNKVKKAMTQKETYEKVKARLIKICNKIGFLKSRCHKFVITHLDELVEELSTTDDVKTICVNVKACNSPACF